MSVTTRRRRFAAIALASVAVLAAATACGGDEESADPNAPITLTVDLFGEQGFGYEKLYEQYMKDHPNIKIVERGKGMGLGDYNTRLTQWIASGTGRRRRRGPRRGHDRPVQGAGEQLREPARPRRHGAAGQLPAVEVGAGGHRRRQAARPRHRRRLDGDVLPHRPLPGRRPADRPRRGGRAVADLGRSSSSSASSSPRRTPRPSSSTPRPTSFNTVLVQNAGAGTGYTYFDKSDKLVIGENPDVKAAWDTDGRDDRRQPVRPACSPGRTSGPPASSRPSSPPSPARPG